MCAVSTLFPLYYLANVSLTNYYFIAQPSGHQYNNAKRLSKLQALKLDADQYVDLKGVNIPLFKAQGFTMTRSNGEVIFCNLPFSFMFVRNYENHHRLLIYFFVYQLLYFLVHFRAGDYTVLLCIRRPPRGLGKRQKKATRQ